MLQYDETSRMLRIAFGENLDAEAVEQWSPRVQQALRQQCEHVILDLSEVEFICSAGLGMLVEIYRTATKNAAEFRAEHITRPVKKLLVETKLLELFAGTGGEGSHLEMLGAVNRQMSRELSLLSFLNTISSNLLKADSPVRVYKQVVEALSRALEVRRVLLLIVQEPQTHLLVFQVAGAAGLDENTLAALEGLQLEEGTLEERCLEQNKAIQLSHEEKLPLDSPLLAALQMESGLVEPFRAGEKSRGLLLLEAQEESEAFFSQTGPILQVFANVCGLIAEKQSLLEHIQLKNEELSRTLVDLNKTQNTLMAASQLAIMAALGRGLTHAVNNKLVPIMGYSQMLSMRLEKQSPEKQKVDAIDEAANGIRQVLEKMRKMTRKNQFRFERQDVRDIIDTSLMILDHVFRDGQIAVVREYAQADPFVDVSRESMIQACLAIFQRLTTAFDGKSERQLTISLHPEEDALEIYFHDNGNWLTAKEMETTEYPFDHPEEMDESLFGLNVVRSIMKDHRGAFTLESGEQHGGTLIILHLPLRQTAPITQGPAA